MIFFFFQNATFLSKVVEMGVGETGVGKQGIFLSLCGTFTPCGAMWRRSDCDISVQNWIAMIYGALWLTQYSEHESTIGGRGIFHVSG